MKKWVTFLATLVIMCALASTSYAKDSVKEPTATPAPAAVAVAPKTGVADNTALLALSTGSAVLGAYALRKAGKAK